MNIKEMFKGLRGKVFSLCVCLVMITVIVFSVFGLFMLKDISRISEETNTKQAKTVRDTSEESMENLVQSYFISYVAAESDITDNAFWNMASGIYSMALQVQEIYDHPENYGYNEVKAPSKKDAGTTTAQLLYSSKANPDDPDLKAQIGRIGTMQEQMVGIVDSSGEIKDCVVALADGASIYVDNTPENRFDKKGRVEKYEAQTRPWYKLAVKKGEMTFTPASKDYYTGKYEVNIGIPVYHDSKLVAVCCGSLSLATVEKLVENAHVGENGFSCIINDSGSILFSNREKGTLGQSNTDNILKNDNKELVALIEDALSGNVNSKNLTVDGEEVCIVYAPLISVGWAQFMVIPRSELEAPTDALLEQLDMVAADSHKIYMKSLRRASIILVIVLLVMIVNALWIGVVFAGRLIHPINYMTEKVEEINADNMIFEMEKVYETGDEIEVLAGAFSGMSKQTVEYIKEITKITAEKQRIGTELAVATNIQMSLLPKDLPMEKQKGFRLFASMNPAKEVGGDFYDYFIIDDTHFAFLMADVSGKGVPAALFMATAKSMIRSRILSGGGLPNEILADVGDQLSETNDMELFVTVWLGIIDLETGHLDFCSAGHEYPGVYRAEKGEYEWLKTKNSPAVALFPGLKFIEHEMELAPGDRIFLYTDGVPESFNSDDEQFGMDRALAALNEAKDVDDPSVLDNVWTRIIEFIGDEPQFDDTTMLSFTYIGLEQDK